MSPKTVLHKEEVIHQLCTKTRQSPLGREKGDTWSDYSMFQVLLLKNVKKGCLALWAKDESNHPSCYPRKVQKPASVWDCIEVHRCSWHWCTGVRHTFLQNSASIKAKSFNTRPHFAQLTAWLHRDRMCAFECARLLQARKTTILKWFV